MDMGFKSYVVLKAISMAQGTEGQSWVPVLIGNNTQQNLEFNAQRLENINFWSSFYTIPINEIEEIINELRKRKIIYSKTVQIEGKRSSMLFLTDKGKKILHILDRKYYSVISGNTFTNSKNWNTIKEKASTVYNYSSYQLYNFFS